MKKIMFSLLVLFATQSAMADVLTLTVTPLNPSVGAQTKYLKVFQSGQVQVTYCDAINGYCAPSTYLATLSWYAMNHIYQLTEQARYAPIETNFPLCTAVPFESKSYTAARGSVILEDGTYPCGAFRQNTSDAAAYLLSILRQYE